MKQRVVDCIGLFRRLLEATHLKQHEVYSLYSGIRLTEKYRILRLCQLHFSCYKITNRTNERTTFHNLFKAKAKQSSIFIRKSATFAPPRLAYSYVGTTNESLQL